MERFLLHGERGDSPPHQFVMSVAIGFGLMHLYWGHVTSLASFHLQQSRHYNAVACFCESG
eukprot:SAG31_NODE_1033_length_10230_cov_15.289014_7_plen_61_part_00